jgi:hypothetical protein
MVLCNLQIASALAFFVNSIFMPLFLSQIFQTCLILIGSICTKVTLLLTVSQSVYLGVKLKSGTFDQRFFFLSKLLSCLFGAPSLTRGRVRHVSVFVIEVYHSLVYLQQYLHQKLKITTK